MSGNEVVERASAAYAVGLIDYRTMLYWIDLGVRAGGLEMPWANVYLPFEWDIEKAAKAAKR